MSLQDDVQRVARLLRDRDLRVVFAESCTAGLVSASLAGVPGISAWLCGSAVTYREAEKQDWLGVSADDLRKFTAVSEPVARQMAVGVLSRTAEAQYAASITGHLGPDAPPGFDGVVFIGVARRLGDTVEAVGVWRRELKTAARLDRQQEAAGLVLQTLENALA